MFSQATADGRLTLTVTFALGTDLDNAQVQVQNRVSQALPRLPQDVQRIGVTTEKASPDFLLVAHLVSPDDRYDMLYLSNFAHLQVKDELARIAGRRRRAGLRRRRVQHARVARSRQARGAAADGHRRRARHPRAERPGRGRRRSARRRRRRTRRSSSRSTRRDGSPPRSEFADIVVRATPRGADYPARATSGASSSARTCMRCAACSTTSRRSPSASRSARARTRSKPSSQVREVMERLKQSFPAGRRVPHRLRPDDLRPRVDPRGRRHALRGHPAGRHRRDGLPADVARVDHPAGRGAGVARRHVRGDARRSASRSTRCRSSASCSRSASSWTMRSSWSRTSSATSSSGLSPIEATPKGDGRSVRADHRDRARAVRGVRADRVRQRPDRPVLPAVRADDRDLDGDLGVQLADVEPGARVAAAARARGAARSRCSAAPIACSAGSSAGFNRFFTRSSAAYAVERGSRAARVGRRRSCSTSALSG